MLRASILKCNINTRCLRYGFGSIMIFHIREKSFSKIQKVKLIYALIQLVFPHGHMLQRLFMEDERLPHSTRANQIATGSSLGVGVLQLLCNADDAYIGLGPVHNFSEKKYLN